MVSYAFEILKCWSLELDCAKVTYTISANALRQPRCNTVIEAGNRPTACPLTHNDACSGPFLGQLGPKNRQSHYDKDGEQVQDK